MKSNGAADRKSNPRMSEPQSDALTTSPQPPLSKVEAVIQTNGGGGRIRTAEPERSGFTVRRV